MSAARRTGPALGWESLDARTRQQFRSRVIGQLAAGRSKPEAMADAAEHWHLRRSRSLQSEVAKLAKRLAAIVAD